ncbi:hypothetical protein [Avibacterium gallinarum]|uniref:hypothetical protein n=1 Tax=Avibacterium gallinarum TaxID=755 RepID=UPI0039FCE04C
MFYFAIPLKAKSVSKNWETISRSLENTINSIFSSDPNSKIVVACHDIPEINILYPENVVFISVDFNTPKSKEQYMADKESKKTIAMKYIFNNFLDEKNIDNSYFMYLDADDILAHDFCFSISNAFASNPDVDDIALYSGYAFDIRRSKIAYLNGKDKIFYRNCGSSFISKINKFDLKDINNNFFTLLRNHTLFPEISIKNSRSVLAFKNPVVCYMVNHGSNDASERVGDKLIENFIDQFECKDQSYRELFFHKFMVK